MLSVATGFAKFLRRATGFSFEVTTDSGDIENTILFDLDSGSSNPEHYSLDVEATRIVIRAPTEQGAFYATQSLRQLLPPKIESLSPVEDCSWPISAVRIDDEPLYGYRGMHLDVSRHFFPVEFVKRYLDWMALHKMNTFHWHLTDDQGWRIEITGYPKLTEVGAWRQETVVGHTLSREASGDGQRYGGFYTQDEIRDVVAYAAERFITVIPEIDMPGHASALLAAYPEFGCRAGDFEVATHFGIFEDVLCPSEATFAMIEDILTEVAGLFPGPFIHVGGDEALKQQWQESAECQAIMHDNQLQNEEQLHSYFVRRVDTIVRGLGKRIIGWDDILDGGLDEKFTVVAWRGLQKAIDAARSGHDVILSPSPFYFDHFQSRAIDEPLAIHGLSTLESTYNLEMMPDDFEADDRDRILGAQGALWTEYIPTEEKAEYMLMPRMCALAEQAWSPKPSRSWDGFLERLDTHFERLDQMRINVSRSHYNVEFDASISHNDTLQVSCRSNGRRHRIRYTLDGSRPSSDSTVYESSISLTESATLRAVAEDTETGTLFGDSILTFAQHKALGREVCFKHAPENSWHDGSEKTIVDGVVSRNGFFLHTEWAGFHGTDMDAVINLGETTDICEINVGFDVSRHRKLYPPTGLEVQTSLDGEEWSPKARIHAAEITPDSRELSATFPQSPAKFVRVICRNSTKVYSHEARGMAPVSIYVDEIAIR